MNTILVIEDEEIIRASLVRLLKRNGYEVVEAESVEQAVGERPLQSVDLVISDLRLPGAPGTAIIPHAAGIPVLIMTSYASVNSAVEAMKLGAVDYIAKPFDHDDMLISVARILKQRSLAKQNALLKQALSEHYPVSGMIGSSPQMKEVFQRIHKVAPTDTTVLILGESGTGKELVARALHEQSRRVDGPFIIVNCAAIPEGLIESELFGHERGAFTGATESHQGLIEVADGGTLFLDEIGELTSEAQARLLRVLQEREIRRVGSTQSRKVDIRLIAATHRDLLKRVGSGEFRNDLYYRLHVMEIALPPLRERGHDIIELARVLLDKGCRRLNRSAMQFSDGALEQLCHYPWPGNVRELENVLERCIILSEGDTLDETQLRLHSDPPAEPQNGHTAPGQVDASPLSLDEYFVQFVRHNESAMTETALASQLGISRKTLWERRQRLGIPRNRSE